MKRAGWFGEQVVRERLNANTAGLAIDLGQHAPADIQFISDIIPTPVLFEVKAQQDEPHAVEPSDAQEAFAADLIRRGIGWCFVRVVYEKRRGGGHKGVPRFRVKCLDILRGPSCVTPKVHDQIVRALQTPSPSER